MFWIVAKLLSGGAWMTSEQSDMNGKLWGDGG